MPSTPSIRPLWKLGNCGFRLSCRGCVISSSPRPRLWAAMSSSRHGPPPPFPSIALVMDVVRWLAALCAPRRFDGESHNWKENWQGPRERGRGRAGTGGIRVLAMPGHAGFAHPWWSTPFLPRGVWCVVWSVLKCCPCNGEHPERQPKHPPLFTYSDHFNLSLVCFQRSTKTSLDFFTYSQITMARILVFFVFSPKKQKSCFFPS